MNTKILAAALGLLVAGGAVADASAAVVTKTTKTVVAHRTARPVVAHKSVTIVHRARPHHLVRPLPGHRLAPRFHLARAARVHLARAFTTKHVVKTTVIR